MKIPMQFDLVLNNNTRKEFLVTVNASEIGNLVERWLMERGKTVRINGFRPGKAPFPVVKTAFGQKAYEAVLHKMVEEALEHLRQTYSLRLMEDPSFDIVQPFNEHESELGFKFKVIFIVQPEIEIKDFSNLKIKKLKVLIPDEMVDEQIEQIAKNRHFYRSLHEKRELLSSDRYLIHMLARHGKKIIKDMDDKSFVLNLSDEDPLSILFKERLKDAKVFDKIEFTHVFYPNYHDRRLKGKTVQFTIELRAIEEQYQLPVGEELAKALSLESLSSLKDYVKSELANRYGSTARLYHKRNLLDELASLYQIEVPEEIVNREFNHVWNALKEEISKNPEEKIDKNDEEMRDQCFWLANRRVRLGVVISEIARLNRIFVTQENIQNAVMKEAIRAGQYARQVFETYQKNTVLLDHMRTAILEEKVVEFVMARSQVEIIEITPDQLNDKMKEILPEFGDESIIDAIEEIRQTGLLVEVGHDVHSINDDTESNETLEESITELSADITLETQDLNEDLIFPDEKISIKEKEIDEIEIKEEEIDEISAEIVPQKKRLDTEKKQKLKTKKRK